MKCDELETEQWLNYGGEPMPCYPAKDVDESIAELKAENRRLKHALWLARANRALEKIAWFKLWNASISTMNPEDGARQEFDKWKKALEKCRAKAKEYK